MRRGAMRLPPEYGPSPWRVSSGIAAMPPATTASCGCDPSTRICTTGRVSACRRRSKSFGITTAMLARPSRMSRASSSEECVV